MGDGRDAVDLPVGDSPLAADITTSLSQLASYFGVGDDDAPPTEDPRAPTPPVAPPAPPLPTAPPPAWEQEAAEEEAADVAFADAWKARAALLKKGMTRAEADAAVLAMTVPELAAAAAEAGEGMEAQEALAPLQPRRRQKAV